MSDIKQHASRAAARAREALLRRGHEEKPLTLADEAGLAAEFDRERGYTEPLQMQSKRAYHLGEGAPKLRFTPPQLREQ